MGDAVVTSSKWPQRGEVNPQPGWVTFLRYRIPRRGLELLHYQAGNPPAVAEIAGWDRITKLTCTSSYDQIGEGKGPPFSRLLSSDPGNDFRRGFGYGVDRNVRLQLVQELPALVSPFRCVRSINSMPEFGDGESADYDWNIADDLTNAPDDFRCGALLALCRNQNARIEDSSQEGGFHGSRYSLTASSTSRAKSLSTTALAPLASSDAITSEIFRPVTGGALITATG